MSYYGLTVRQAACRGQGPDGLLCVDLEDWHQILLRRFGLESRHCKREFRRGLDALLQLLADEDQKATFFVLGMTVAEEPEVLADLATAGHEVATHGWGHVHLEQLSTAEFEADLMRAMDLLRDEHGLDVVGHRAPEFSIPPERVPDFFEVLARAGLAYDSSVYPFAGRRYGLPKFHPNPVWVETEAGSVLELPLATLSAGPKRFPIAGGGYWRLLPRPLLSALMKQARRQGVLLTTYIHNYEFDPQRLAITEVAEAASLTGPWRRVEVTQNLFRRSMPSKLKTLIRELDLVPCRDYLTDTSLPPA